MFDLETLTQEMGEELVEEARRSMDLLSVSGFRFDRRGRIEGGVKPAPPATEKPAFARLTIRGRRFFPECRIHGKGKWCLHVAILVVHHLGMEPIYRTRQPPKPDPEPVALDFCLIAAIDDEGVNFRVRGRAPGTFARSPLRLIQREPALFHLDAEGVALLRDVAEETLSGFHVERRDAASLLNLLWRTILLREDGSPWRKRERREPWPTVQVDLKRDQLHWRMTPPFSPDSLVLPGWPGFVAREDLLEKGRGYLPDFQFLSGLTSPLPLEPRYLEPFLRERHGIHWQGEKPRRLTVLEQVGLVLDHEGDELVGRLGVWLNGTFFPLAEGACTPQVLRQGDQTHLLAVNTASMAVLDEQRRRVRAPWDAAGGRFHVRRGQVQRFLEQLETPSTWRVTRDDADRYFGLVRLDARREWRDGTLVYQIGDEAYAHDALMAGLTQRDQVRLAHGRTLQFDTGILLESEAVLTGVKQLHTEAPAQQRLLERIFTSCRPSAESTLEITAEWRARLRSYQAEGVAWLLGNFAREEPSLLADDMGLGKTIQTLAFLDLVRTQPQPEMAESGETQPQLVVVPTSLLANWREECARFCPERQVTLHHGPKRARQAEDLAACDLVLTTYGTLRRDIDLLYDVAFQVVVLDEAQTIKNAASQVSRAAAELWSQHRLALTGTPVENRLLELWAIFQFLAPGYLGDETEVKSITVPGTPGYAALQAKVAPFLLRRDKGEVAKELPQKQEIVVRLPLAEAQQARYDQFRAAARGQVQKKGSTLSILTQLLRLRQICCHPGLVAETAVSEISNKFAFLLDHLAEIIAAGHAALIFSQFTRLLELLKFNLEERDISFLYLDGRTTNRQAVVDRFQDGGGDVFLISLKAGGTGLNLTRASYVYHLDPWWNPMVEAQATDRAHRIGQTKAVFAYKLISAGTVEEKILDMQRGKKTLADGLWRAPEQGLGGLDQEALLALLQ